MRSLLGRQASLTIAAEKEVGFWREEDVDERTDNDGVLVTNMCSLPLAMETPGCR